jgi:hypothetical protein
MFMPSDGQYRFMSTLELAKAKWARNTAGKGNKWKSGVSGKSGSYAEGLSRFAGATAGPTMQGHYAAGVDAVSAEQFSAAVSGKEGKWADKLREAIES